MTVTQIAVASIDAGNNDRKAFDEGPLQQLAESIRRDGLIQPITVVEADLTLEGPRYRIVAGERRFRAIQLLGLDEVPCIVRELDPDAESRVMLAENTIRCDLDPIEEAVAYQRRLDAGTTLAELEAEGHRRSRIELVLPLLTLRPEVQHLIARRQLAVTLARKMIGLCENRQILALGEYSKNELTSSQFQALCDRLRKEQADEPLFDPDSFLRNVEWAKGKAAFGPLGQARVMLKRAAQALADVDPGLAQEIRDWLAAQNK